MCRQTVENVFQRYQSIDDGILRMPPLEQLSCRSPISKRPPPPPAAKESEDDETPVADFQERFKRTTGNKKMILECFRKYEPPITDETPRIIGFKPLDLLKDMAGVHRLDLDDPDTLLKCNKLLEKWRLAPVTPFQIENDVHYGVYDSDGNLLTYIAILTGVYDRSPCPKRIAVSVDWIVDSNPGKSDHKATLMVDYLKEKVVNGADFDTT